MNMRIEYDEKDIHFSVELDDRLCLLYMSSGEGKTLLFRTLSKAVYESWRDRYYYYDYTMINRVLDDMNKYQDKENIIIFDNADLYTDSIIKVIKNSKARIIVVTKSLVWLGKYSSEFGRYYIEHTTDRVAMRKKR